MSHSRQGVAPASGIANRRDVPAQTGTQTGLIGGRLRKHPSNDDLGYTASTAEYSQAAATGRNPSCENGSGKSLQHARFSYHGMDDSSSSLSDLHHTSGSGVLDVSIATTVAVSVARGPSNLSQHALAARIADPSSTGVPAAVHYHPRGDVTMLHQSHDGSDLAGSFSAGSAGSRSASATGSHTVVSHAHPYLRHTAGRGGGARSALEQSRSIQELSGFPTSDSSFLAGSNASGAGHGHSSLFSLASAAASSSVSGSGSAAAGGSGDLADAHDVGLNDLSTLADTQHMPLSQTISLDGGAGAVSAAPSQTAVAAAAAAMTSSQQHNTAAGADADAAAAATGEAGAGPSTSSLSHNAPNSPVSVAGTCATIMSAFRQPWLAGAGSNQSSPAHVPAADYVAPADCVAPVAGVAPPAGSAAAATALSSTAPAAGAAATSLPAPHPPAQARQSAMSSSAGAQSFTRSTRIAHPFATAAAAAGAAAEPPGSREPNPKRSYTQADAMASAASATTGYMASFAAAQFAAATAAAIPAPGVIASSIVGGRSVFRPRDAGMEDVVDVDGDVDLAAPPVSRPSYDRSIAASGPPGGAAIPPARALALAASMTAEEDDVALAKLHRSAPAAAPAPAAELAAMTDAASVSAARAPGSAQAPIAAPASVPGSAPAAAAPALTSSEVDALLDRMHDRAHELYSYAGSKRSFYEMEQLEQSVPVRAAFCSDGANPSGADAEQPAGAAGFDDAVVGGSDRTVAMGRRAGPAPVPHPHHHPHHQQQQQQQRAQQQQQGPPGLQRNISDAVVAIAGAPAGAFAAGDAAAGAAAAGAGAVVPSSYHASNYLPHYVPHTFFDLRPMPSLAASGSAGGLSALLDSFDWVKYWQLRSAARDLLDVALPVIRHAWGTQPREVVAAVQEALSAAAAAEAAEAGAHVDGDAVAAIPAAGCSATAAAAGATADPRPASSTSPPTLGAPASAAVPAVLGYADLDAARAAGRGSNYFSSCLASQGLFLTAAIGAAMIARLLPPPDAAACGAVKAVLAACEGDVAAAADPRVARHAQSVRATFEQASRPLDLLRGDVPVEAARWFTPITGDQVERLERPSQSDIHSRLLHDWAVLVSAEAAAGPVPDYMASVQTEVEPWMRQRTVQWIFDAAERLHLYPVTVASAVIYMDRFLATSAVRRAALPLIAATCLFIAGKFHERMPPPLRAIVELAQSPQIVTHQLMRETEVIILNALRWRLYVITPHIMLDQMLMCFPLPPSVDGKRMQEHAEFFSELSFCEYSFAPVPATVLSLASALAAFHLLRENPLEWARSLLTVCTCNIHTVLALRDDLLLLFHTTFPMRAFSWNGLMQVTEDDVLFISTSDLDAIRASSLATTAPAAAPVAASSSSSLLTLASAAPLMAATSTAAATMGSGERAVSFGRSSNSYSSNTNRNSDSATRHPVAASASSAPVTGLAIASGTAPPLDPSQHATASPPYPYPHQYPHQQPEYHQREPPPDHPQRLQRQQPQPQQQPPQHSRQQHQLRGAVTTTTMGAYALADSQQAEPAASAHHNHSHS